MDSKNYFVGLGYDSHKFVRGKKLVLGGLEIDFPFGLKAHSDGDVVLHSVADAILGACGMKDIGEIFPDSEEKYKNIDSKIIIKKILRDIRKKKFRLVNIDIVVVCDKPKISPMKDKIKKSLCEIFGIKNINIKGKTTEGEESNFIKVFSVVMVKR